MDAVVAVALLSALLHAAWNAAVRAAADPRRAMAAQIVASGLVVAPLLLVLPLPSPEALPWLAASVACSVLAVLALVRGYADGGGFAVVYPLTRAVSPLLVTLLARLLVGERLTPGGYAGVAMVSSGVGLFAVGGGRAGLAAVGWGLTGGSDSARFREHWPHTAGSPRSGPARPRSPILRFSGCTPAPRSRSVRRFATPASYSPRSSPRSCCGSG